MSQQGETGAGKSSAVVAEASALSRVCSQRFSEETSLKLSLRDQKGN